MNKLKRIIEWFEIVILIIAIVLVGFMFLNPCFDWQAHPVLSGSMEPELNVGGVIVTRPVKLEDIKTGDIITFQTEQGFKVTHRVIDIVKIGGKLYFQTQGDANEEADFNFVSSRGEEIKKVVFHLPYFGFVAQFMKSKLTFLVLIGVTTLILIVLFSRDIWKEILKEKTRKNGQS